MEPANYSNDVISRIQSMITYGCKVLDVENKDGFIHISVIKGIEIVSGDPAALVNKEKYTLTDELADFLKSTEFISAIYSPKRRGIILIDIVGYSKFENLHQCALLTLFSRTLKQNIEIFGLNLPFNPIEQLIPTGDGCYIITDEKIVDRFYRIGFGLPALLHVTQNQILLREFSKNHKTGDRVQIRISCHVGECDFFTDVSGNRNCYGDGLNEASRILSCGQKAAEEQYPCDKTEGTVFLSNEVNKAAESTIRYMNDKLNLGVLNIDLGLLPDKHGKTRQVWWVHNLHKYSAFNLYSVEECLEKGWITK